MKKLLITGVLLVFIGATVPAALAQETGRLDPEPDEYYTLYCLNDTLEIYRSVPERELLVVVPFNVVVQQARGSTISVGSDISITRHDDFAYTVSGSNGNRAPEPGEKNFGMNNCFLLNMGMPIPAPTVARTPQAERPTPFFQEGDDPTVLTCVYYFSYFNIGAEGLFDCTRTVSSVDDTLETIMLNPGAPPAGISVFTIILYLCPGGFFGIAAVLAPSTLRRRRRKSGAQLSDPAAKQGK